MSTAPWLPVETDIKSVLEQYAFPLKALADGIVPALIFRKAFNFAHCAGLVNRFYERGLLYDPRQNGEINTTRVDIGTSLGRHSRDDPEIFFSHARETRMLFETLFDGYTDPVRFIYQTLYALAPGKQVMTARESADRLYGPAIFRTYYEGSGHTPHFDSVRKRSRLFNYSVSRFDRQFAAVLCLQNAVSDSENGQAFLYRRQWSPDIQDKLPHFKAYATEQGIERIRIELAPGDFYVFCSETIHEVPPPIGDRPRIVLAAFFAMSDNDDEIYVWS